MLQVRLFDYEHEQDLQKELNAFLAGFSSRDIIDIKYNVSAATTDKEQIYCFSAMVIYQAK
ncbi:sporulation protein Cse60 [Bacillus spongiae]|uniref:Sporulation protein Cse60 n=1 Tax=Bacillus spongiae TaxID=2683610 RepID=A0ABU8HHR1_9BACI